MADLDLTDVTTARAQARAQQDEIRLGRLGLSEAVARRDAANGRGDLTAAATAQAEADRLGAEIKGSVSRTLAGRLLDRSGYRLPADLAIVRLPDPPHTKRTKG